jgi:hypothetical protein
LEPRADLLRSLVAAKSGITLAQIQAELKALIVAACTGEVEHALNVPPQPGGGFGLPVPDRLEDTEDIFGS